MQMTADQAKAAASQAILEGVQVITTQMANACAGSGEGGAEGAEQFGAHLAHLRQMEATAHRLIDKAFDEPKEEPKGTEPDDDYRVRLQRVVGEGSIHSAALRTATARGLDDVGAHYGVKRK